MHICFISHEYPLWGTGGIGSYIQTIGRGLVKAGHTVSVVGQSNLPDGDFIEDQGVSIYRLPAPKGKSLQFIENSKNQNQKLWEIHKNNPIDIIEGAESYFAFIDTKLPCKRIIRMHGGHHFFAVTLNKKPAFWRGFQEKRSFRNATHICAVSNYVGETTRKLLKLKDRKITTIYNPIDTSKFSQADYKKSKKNQLLFVGTVCEKKGINQLIEAIPKVACDVPEISLIAVGRDWSSKEIPSYIDYLKKRYPEIISKYVIFVGAVDHNKVVEFIEESEICVYPSHMEAMPIAWLEVLAMGKPFIGSTIGPGYEAVSEGQTGLLADPYKPDDIAEKILFGLKNPDKMQEMGYNARKDVLTRFDINMLIEKNISFYQECIGNN